MPRMMVRPWSAALALAFAVPFVHGCCGRWSKCIDVDDRPEVSPGAPSVLGPPRTGGLPPSPDLAVVVTQEGIVGIDVNGKRVRLVAPETDVSWCRIDRSGHVLWYRHGMNGTLSLVDLESDAAAPVKVLEHTPDTVVIAYPWGELGLPGAHEFDEGVRVRVEDPPRIEAVLGCDGDMAFSCFGDEVDDFEAAHAKLLAELDARLKAEPLLARDVLAAVAQRSGSTRDTTSPLGPEPEQVTTVPREPCSEAPEDCGSATRLAGTPYWLVVVANSRGDFFHETRQLYDPKEAEFFDPRDPKERSRQPLAGSGDTFVPRWVSPSRELGLGEDALVRLEGGIVASGFSEACGFWGGGWEIDGG